MHKFYKINNIMMQLLIERNYLYKRNGKKVLFYTKFKELFMKRLSVQIEQIQIKNQQPNN